MTWIEEVWCLRESGWFNLAWRSDVLAVRPPYFSQCSTLTLVGSSREPRSVTSDLQHNISNETPWACLSLIGHRQGTSRGLIWRPIPLSPKALTTRPIQDMGGHSCNTTLIPRPVYWYRKCHISQDLTGGGSIMDDHNMSIRHEWGHYNKCRFYFYGIL